MRSYLLCIVLSILLLLSLTSGMNSFSSYDPSSEQKMKAATYIAQRYNETLGLVSESEDEGINAVKNAPVNNTYWITSDNLWAQEVLKDYYPEIAENISETITPYLQTYGYPHLFEVVLGMQIPIEIHDKRNIVISNPTINGIKVAILYDRHHPEDGDIFYDADEYADLCFYLSLNYYLKGDLQRSEEWFRTGEVMWNGYGFFDKAANESDSDPSKKRYQNYKLGLFLFTQRVTGFSSSIVDQVEEVAWSYQKQSGAGEGGITTQSYLNGTFYGTANVETTSALLLTYDERLISAVRARTTTFPETVTVYFIDVNQGDGIIIDTSRDDVLIDAGTRRKGGQAVLDTLQLLSIEQIDLVIATHPDADHIGGLITVLNSSGLHIDSVLYTNESRDTQTYRDFITLAKERNYLVASRGESFVLAGGVILTVFNPVQPLEFTDSNDNSIVIKITVGRTSFLMTGDCEFECEMSILDSGLNVTSNILKVGHHGSRSSSSSQFLDAVDPEIAVISAGMTNRYGHPHQEVLERLENRSIISYGTYKSGTITISVDGNGYNVVGNPVPIPEFPITLLPLLLAFVITVSLMVLMNRKAPVKSSKETKGSLSLV